MSPLYMVFRDELLAEGRCGWCAGPLLPLPLDGHTDCFRRALRAVIVGHQKDSKK